MPIAGTDDDELYQNQRIGNFSYAIPVPDGYYDVTLYFASITNNAPFALSVGDKTMENFDIEASERSGAANTAYTYEIKNVLVSNVLGIETSAGGALAGVVMRKVDTGGLNPAEGKFPIIKTEGCGKDPGPLEGTVTFDGNRTSKYIVRLPKNYDQNRAYPVIITLHGSYGRYGVGDVIGEDALQLWFDHPNPGGLVWGNNAEIAHKVYRPGFEHVAKDFCLDRNGVFMTGNSQGGRGSATGGCWVGDLFRGVAPGNPGGPDVDSVEECNGNVLFFGISSTGDQNNFPKMTFYVEEIFTKQNQCSNETVELEYNRQCRMYLGCKPGYEVIRCTPPGPHRTWWMDKAAVYFIQRWKEQHTLP